MNFSQLLLVLKARKFFILLPFFVTVATTTLVSLWWPPSYEATTSLVIDFKGADPVSGLPVPPQLIPGYMATQVDVIGSHNVAGKVVDTLRLAESPVVKQQFLDDTNGTGAIRDWTADLLLTHLKVEPSRESSVVEVSYSGSDPKFAAVIANAFAAAYITTNLELKVEPARQTSLWYDGQVKSLRDNLEAAQAKLSSHQRKQGIVVVDERLDVKNSRLQEISSQLVAAQAQAYDATSRLNQIKAALDEGKSAEALPEIIGNPLIQSMKADLARAQTKLADVAKRVGPNHPEYLRAATEVESQRKHLDEEVTNATKGIRNTAGTSQSRVEQLKKALADQKAEILTLTSQRDDFAVLTREVESAQKMLDVAMLRSGQTRLESQTNHTDIAVLNPALPPLEPSSPKLLLNIALSIFLGALLGLGAGFLAEMIDRHVRSAEDLAEALGVPVLGVLGGAKRRWFTRGMRKNKAGTLRKPQLANARAAH